MPGFSCQKGTDPKCISNKKPLFQEGKIMNHRIRPFSYISLLSLAITLAFAISCSDSESRFPYTLGMTKVIMDLGLGGSASKSASGARMSAAPTGITSITVTVSAPDMAPQSYSFDATATSIDMKIPSGQLRQFIVVAETPEMVYSGKAVATLPPDTTVSVPVVMTAGLPINLPEGTILNPTKITANSGPYIGHVGTGRSYYTTDRLAGDLYLSVTVKNMTDDVDLLSWGEGPGFISIPSSPLFGETYCGRTKDETLNSDLVRYYFAIDGSHTTAGATYVIICTSTGNSTVPPPSPGIFENPILVPTGFPFSARTVGDAEYTPSYYYAHTVPDKVYSLRMSGHDPMTYSFLYSNRLYTESIGDIMDPFTAYSFTAPSNTLYFNIVNSNFLAETITMELVANEGTPSNPVRLFADETWFGRRANFCMVGPGGRSYYRIPANRFPPSYMVYVSEALNSNITVNVYTDMHNEPPFITVSSTSEYSQSVFADNGFIYLEVIDNSGTGSTFILDAQWSGGG
jgi:hypothetical protein